MENDKEKSGMEKVLGCIWTWVGIVVLVGVVWWFYPSLSSLRGMQNGTGQSKYDGLDSLFSGLAFAGLITALYFQREDLKLQREELKLQREEMQAATEEQERHRDVFEKQQRNNELQRFESSFSSLVERMYEARNSVFYKRNTGLEAINILYRKLCDSPDECRCFTYGRDNYFYDNYENCEDIELKYFEYCVNNIFDSCRGWVVSWAMCVYFINYSSVLSKEERKVYFSYLTDVLSSSEGAILTLSLRELPGVDLADKVIQICRENGMTEFSAEPGFWVGIRERCLSHV